jgi:regulator of replication initiation timing
MIVDGARFQYDFKAKEKQLRATITSQADLIEALKKELALSVAEFAVLNIQLGETKQELAAVRARFRNFKAQVKAPSRFGKEQSSDEVA